MLDLDTFKWNNTELFKYLHKVLPKDFQQTHNILEVKDDMLFVWNESEKCLLSLNWRASMAKGSAVQYQVRSYESILPLLSYEFNVGHSPAIRVCVLC